MNAVPDPSSQRPAETDFSRSLLAGQGAATLAERLAAEMSRRWHQGERPSAEEFLNRHPDLWQQPEAAADLIYEEICLRQEAGEKDPAEVLLRFPQWQAQLEILLRFHQALGNGPAAPKFPEAGETIGEFALLMELGRGARGRVFLATQPSLAGRQMVLKFVPRDGQEHISLARLQHTHIVPIYSVQDVPGRNLQVLVMPYFGGATLAQVLSALAERPPGLRKGQDLLRILDQHKKAGGVGLPAGGFGRTYLSRATYVQAVCWIGAGLAEALHFAHEHGLVHLDVKPSNILLGANGQPMLLDFHLARAPIQTDGPLPEWVGGTADYLSPEQEKAMGAVRAGQRAPVPVDGRSDVYSLGLVLCEALGGKAPAAPRTTRERLDHCHPHLSVGLADIVHKCLAPAPNDRYAKAADLANDLRRHLADMPLRGVPNRSLRERWHKWRRRQPQAQRVLALSAAVLLAVAAVFSIALAHLASWSEPRLLLEQARVDLGHGEHDQAKANLQRGLALAQDLPWHQELMDELKDELDRVNAGKRQAQAMKLLEQGKKAYAAGDYAAAHETFGGGRALLKGLTALQSLDDDFQVQAKLAERAVTGQHLHKLIDEVRFLYGADSLPQGELESVDYRCRLFWDKRQLLTGTAGPALPAALQKQIAADLLDLALLWTDLRTRPTVKDKKAAAEEALLVLAEAEQRFGSSQVLCRDRQRHAQTLGLADLAAKEAKRAEQLPPRTEWEHYALGLWFLRAAEPKQAAEPLRQAVALYPQSLWCHFYWGKCTYLLGQYEDTVVAFAACIALAPTTEQRAKCYYNRGLAYSKWDRPEQAISDYNSALKLDATLGQAALNRGILHYQHKHYTQAISDLSSALDKQGVDKSLVYYNLALTHRDAGDPAAAIASAKLAVQHNPQQETARALLNSLIDMD